MKHLLLLVAICLASFSCSSSGKSSTENNDQTTDYESLDNGGRWILSLFAGSEDGKFSQPSNENDFTPRLHEFFQEAYMLYDTRSGNEMSDAELEQAKAHYKEKWSGIYPAKEDAIGLFGAGDDDMEPIENVKVVPLGDLRYNVTVEYEWRGPILSTVRLIEQGDKFVIDEMSCKYIKPEPQPLLLPVGKRCFTNSDEGGDITTIEMNIASDCSVKGVFQFAPGTGEPWQVSFEGIVQGYKLRIEFDELPSQIDDEYSWLLRRKWYIETYDLGNGEESEVLTINFYGFNHETGEPGDVPFTFIECARKNWRE